MVLAATLASVVNGHVLQAAPVVPQAGTLNKAGNAKPPAFNVFGSLELKTKPGVYSQHWRKVIRRAHSERSIYESCDSRSSKCHAKVKAWRRFIQRVRNVRGWDLLAAVNGKVNRLISYADDIKQYGRKDHWASPLESLTGRGDCEDYVILKYLSLAELGVPEDDMRVVIVKDIVRGIGHAVLAVKHAGETYILDSLRKRPRLHTAIKRYRPHYSLSANGNWVNVKGRKRTTKVAAVKPASQTPAQAQAMLPDYAKNQTSRNTADLGGSTASSNTIQ